jgi:FKBP-type peptidyl-prolyl cis-trans isomerase FkpA
MSAERPRAWRAIVPLTCVLLLAGCGAPEGEVEDERAGAVADADIDGLRVQTLEPGAGDAIEAGEVAVVDYTGWLYDPEAPDARGRRFDSSLDRGEPFRFTVGAGEVIAGWDQGVAGMRPGERRELVIPPELGYGSRGAGGVIPPNAVLLFEVELREIE